MARMRKTAKTRPADRLQRKKRMGALIREARGDAMTQADLGAALGEIPQTTISRWEAGNVDLTLEQVYDLEVALGLPLGSLAAGAGYAVSDFDSKSVLELMRSDPSILPELRGDVMRTYKSYVAISKKLAAQPTS